MTQRVHEILGRFRNTIAENNTSPEFMQLFDSFLATYEGISSPNEQPTETVTVSPSPQKSQKPETRRGTLSLPERKNYGRWSATEKLDYIEYNYDSDTGKYNNGDRQWLIRASKAHRCYTTCCGLSIDMFLSKYGNKNGGKNFSLTEVKGCDTCRD